MFFSTKGRPDRAASVRKAAGTTCRMSFSRCSRRLLLLDVLALEQCPSPSERKDHGADQEVGEAFHPAVPPGLDDEVDALDNLERERSRAEKEVRLLGAGMGKLATKGEGAGKAGEGEE